MFFKREQKEKKKKGEQKMYTLIGQDVWKLHSNK